MVRRSFGVVGQPIDVSGDSVEHRLRDGVLLVTCIGFAAIVLRSRREILPERLRADIEQVGEHTLCDGLVDGDVDRPVGDAGGFFERVHEVMSFAVGVPLCGVADGGFNGGIEENIGGRATHGRYSCR